MICKYSYSGWAFYPAFLFSTETTDTEYPFCGSLSGNIPATMVNLFIS